MVELGYARVGDVEILLPRAFGEEAARTKRASRVQHRWTEADLMAALAAEGTPEEVAAARRLFEWAASQAHHIYWGEGQTPSCTMAFAVPEGMIQPCSIYTAGTGSHGVAINFDWMRRRPRPALERLLDQLGHIPTVARQRGEILAKDFAKRPTVPLAELTGDRMTSLINALTDLLTHPRVPDGTEREAH